MKSLEKCLEKVNKITTLISKLIKTENTEICNDEDIVILNNKQQDKNNMKLKKEKKQLDHDLLIEKLCIKNEQDHEDIKCKKINIFVGPNNSGKSLLLNEILSFGTDQETKRIQNIELNNDLIKQNIKKIPDTDKIEFFGIELEIDDKDLLHKDYAYYKFNTSPSNGVVDFDSHQRNVERNVKKSHIPKKFFLEPENQIYKRYVMSFVSNRLTSSINNIILSSKYASSKMAIEKNILGYIIYNKEVKEEIRKYIKEGIGNYITFNTNGSSIEIYLIDSENYKNISLDEKENLENDSTVKTPDILQKYKAKKIDDMSDGFKNYINFIIISVFYSKQSYLIFVDEPEISLHPSFAKTLGRQLREIFLKQGSPTQLFISTHSSKFIEGLVEDFTEKNTINVIRPNYYNNKQSLHFVEYDNLIKCYKDTVLRTNNFLEGFFYDFIILVEGKNDIIIYKNIFNKIGSSNLSVLFMEVNGKDRILHHKELLEKIGLTVFVIIDFDGIKDCKLNFKNITHSDIQKFLFLKDPESNIDFVRYRYKNDIKELDLDKNKYKKFENLLKLDNDESNEKAQIKKKGINYFIEKNNTEAMEKLSIYIEKCSQQHNIFFVPVGEVEGWFKNLKNKRACSVTNKSSMLDYLIENLDRLNADSYNTYTDNKGNEINIESFLKNIIKTFNKN